MLDVLCKCLGTNRERNTVLAEKREGKRKKGSLVDHVGAVDGGRTQKRLRR